MKTSHVTPNKPSRPPEEAKHGQGLRHAVEARRQELEVSLAELQNSRLQNSTIPLAIEDALAMLNAMLPADLDHISPVIAGQLANWLETHKHLGIIDREPPHVGLSRHPH